MVINMVIFLNKEVLYSQVNVMRIAVNITVIHGDHAEIHFCFLAVFL